MSLINPAFSFNAFDSNNLNERITWANQLDEVSALFGANFIYLDVNLGNVDEIFGEHLQKVISSGTNINLWIEEFDQDTYPEDNGMYSKFGFVPNLDNITVYATPDYFVQHGITIQQQDLLYYVKTKKIWEINHITELDEYKIKLDLGLYSYDHTKIDTDTITETDILELENYAAEELTKISTPIETAVEDDEILDTDNSDGLYD